MTKSATADAVTPVSVGVHEAKTRLSELLRLVEAGQQVEITRGGSPVARLVPARERRTRRLGTDRGRFSVPDDFDAPLPDDIAELFTS